MRTDSAAPPEPELVSDGAARGPVRWDRSSASGNGYDPGATHAAYSLAAMLTEALRDEQALARSPLRTVVIGSGDGWIAARMLEAGVGSVVVADWREAAVSAALELRDRLAFSPEEMVARHVAELAELASRVPGPFDVAFVAREVGDRSAAIRFAWEAGAGLCAIESTSRLEDRDAARAAGFGRVRLADPPADAERRLILRERALVLASRTAESGRP